MKDSNLNLKKLHTIIKSSINKVPKLFKEQERCMRAFCVKKKNIAMFLISAPTNSQILIFKVLPIYYNTWPFFLIGSFLLLPAFLYTLKLKKKALMADQVDSLNKIGVLQRYQTKLLNIEDMCMSDSFNDLLL